MKEKVREGLLMRRWTSSDEAWQEAKNRKGRLTNQSGKGDSEGINRNMFPKEKGVLPNSSLQALRPLSVNHREGEEFKKQVLGSFSNVALKYLSKIGQPGQSGIRGAR